MAPTTIGQHEVHEAASIFPLAEGDDLVALAADIQEHGLLAPIELFDDKVLDGRRRYLACESIGYEPEFVDVAPTDPVAYVVSLNLHRRHLNESQRAMVGGRVESIYATAAKERMRAGKKQDPRENLPEGLTGRARDQAGKTVNVSGKSVDHAAKVIDKGDPELASAVDSGKVAVSMAAKVADLPKPEQRKAVKAFQAGDKKALKKAIEPAKPPRCYPVSDAFMAWTASLSGVRTKIKQDHGSYAEMIASSGWDKTQTSHALEILKCLKTGLSELYTEAQQCQPK